MEIAYLMPLIWYFNSYQHQFVTVETTDNSTIPNTTLVTGARVAVHENFGNGLYDSCQWINLNGIVVRDTWPTKEIFFNMMGHQALSPVQIDFIFVENDTALNAPTFNCAEVIIIIIERSN
jgi:hypothetical protein